jgi:hypothetical protein
MLEETTGNEEKAEREERAWSWLQEGERRKNGRLDRRRQRVQGGADGRWRLAIREDLDNNSEKLRS